MYGLPKNPSKNQIADYQKYFNKELPKGFSEDGIKAHNDAVIASTIRKSNAYHKKRMAEFKDQLGERVEAVTSWLMHQDTVTRPLDKYLGKSYLAHLRGQQIMMILADRQRGLYKVIDATNK